MTRLVALPHLQTGEVALTDWLVTIRGETIPVPDLLKGWDYATPFRLECRMSVDRPRALAECGLGEGSRIRAVATYWASSTNRRAVGATIEILDSSECAMSFEVDPALVGGRLTLQRQLVLEQGVNQTSEFAADRAGAVLWDEARATRTSMLLEGDAARFPTEVIDFASGRIAEPASAWWLELDFSELDASPLASMRLYINKTHPRMDRLLSGKDDESSMMVSAIMAWDVSRTMVHTALDSSEFVDGWGQYRTGSLGDTLENLLRTIWPTHDARALRAMRNNDRGVFDARLQGRTDALGQPSR